ncbi:RNA-binding protein 42 [Anomaloglossus baeobatrachus]|uniref:RNA-binding protein 42 n=1 Tax=Anomaloglossus baeobatrachus TaxID=238106 RepID=UPI003F5042C7
MAGKSGEEKLKAMEAEMALFEQEVLGAPVALPPGDPVQLPVPLAITAVPVIRPVIATNTYSQVQQSLEARAAAAANVVPPLMVPPVQFVGPASIPPPRPPLMRPSFIPHALQRPMEPHPVMPRPSFIPHVLQQQRAMGPRLPGMPPLQPLMAHPMHGPPPPLMSHMPPPPLNMRTGPPPAPVGPMPPPPRSVIQSSPKINPTVIQAAPTVYTAPPVRKVEEEIPETPPLTDDKDLSYDETVIGPSMPELEPVQPEVHVVLEPVQEDKKKMKPEKLKRCIRTAAGTSWEDQSLLEWDTDDFRIFCGDLGNEVNDDILARAFSRYPSFLKAKVIRDKRTGKTKGYGFVSFKDPNDYVRAMREMNGKYVGSRPIKLRKSMWKDRNIDIVRKKQREKKKLGLR